MKPLREIQNAFVLALLCVSITGCTKRTSIGNGYELVLKGSESVSHIPGTCELHHVENGRDQLVGVYIIAMTGPLVRSNLALFNAGLSDDRKWVGDPAILAYVPPGPPVEITEPILRYYCGSTGKDYAKAAGCYSFAFPEWTNGMIAVEGHSQSAAEEFIHLSFSTNQLLDFVKEVQAKGVERRYGRMKYRIEAVSK